MHAFGDTIPLKGQIQVEAADGTLSPYSGPATLLLWPPRSDTYNSYGVTIPGDGTSFYEIDPTEPGYTDGPWTYRLEIDGPPPGASQDYRFAIAKSLKETTTVSP
jgi:hypothetical protein